MKGTAIFALPALVFGAYACTSGKGHPDRPNVVFILADDLGYGDLSCLGQEHFETPNIDRLAEQGMLFTQHYAGSSVSAPSRSSLITGQHTGHTPVRGNKEGPVEGQYPIPGDTYNIFRMLKDNGYATGVFGKWGLGYPGSEGAPENQGVDEFYGYNCQRLAHNYYPYHLWHNSEKIVLTGNSGHSEGDYAPYLIHDKALGFIEAHASEPFFLWYTTTIPHAELRLPESETSGYVGKVEPEKRYEGCDSGPDYKNGGYGSQECAHAAFAAMVSLLDKQVGEIAAKLESLGIADNTILIFTSDNGPHCEGGAAPEYFNSNGEFRGLKRDLYEGGIRVPLIVRWPSRVKAGFRTDHISAFWDFMPTMADIIGADGLSEVDGISFLPTLLGKGCQKTHDWLYWEFHEAGGRQAVRKDNWKGVIYNVSKGGHMQLYDLSSVPGEQHDVAASHPEIVSELEDIIRGARTESPIFNFVLPTYNGDVGSK